MSRLAVVILCMLMISCEISTEWEITPSQERHLVVEAILTNETRVQEIRLSTSYDTLNSAAAPVSDAVVSVKAGNTTYVLSHDPADPGLYKSNLAFAVVPQLEYELNITWNNDTYSASTVLSEVAPLQPLFFAHAATLGNFTIDENVVPIYNLSQQAMYRIDLDWSHLQPQGENIARVYAYTFNTVHVSEFLRPGREDIIFPSGTIATITKYGLTDDFADYLRSVVIETDWNGNWFFGNPENPPTNISNGAFGYFAACAVVTDTVIVE